MNSLRLLIVDDEPLIRRGIRKDLSEIPSVQVVGECECVADAVDAIEANRPDLVLLDVQLPDGTGFDVVRQVGPEHIADEPRRATATGTSIDDRYDDAARPRVGGAKGDFRPDNRRDVRAIERTEAVNEVIPER